jgi:AcrR family transcriptional regulator
MAEQQGENGLVAAVNEVDGSAEMDRLPVKQRGALEALAKGMSVADAAAGVGVSRGTVYHWLKNDAAFGAAYNQWHEMMEQSCRSRLRMMLDKASSALEKALEGGDAKAALQLLKGMGMIRGEDKERSTDAEEIAQERRIERAQRKARLKSDEMFSGFGV